MTLTNAERERLRLNAAAMLAFAGGKAIERRWNWTWHPYTEMPDFYHDTLRPAPLPSAPVVRPWGDSSDVPGPVCWIRWTKRPSHQVNACAMICSFSNEGVGSVGTSEDGRAKAVFTSWQDIAEHEYSTTRAPGSWLPCQTLTPPPRA
jgi:hypothetical protein